MAYAYPQEASAGTLARQSEVQVQLERGAKAVANLEVVSDNLHERLQSILRAPQPPPPNKGESPRPVLVGHASALANHNDQLEMLGCKLSDILDRIEL